MSEESSPSKRKDTEGFSYTSNRYGAHHLSARTCGFVHHFCTPTYTRDVLYVGTNTCVEHEYACFALATSTSQIFTFFFFAGVSKADTAVYDWAR